MDGISLAICFPARRGRGGDGGGGVGPTGGTTAGQFVSEDDTDPSRLPVGAGRPCTHRHTTRHPPIGDMLTQQDEGIRQPATR